MKILAIRGENLASLTGKFELNFREEPLFGAGLFAITGATGAGKSTLLDALCLALYGRYPRVDQAGKEESTDASGEAVFASSTSNILSRGKGSCFAEVEFEGGDGVEYRVSWMLRRARENAEGKLQQPKRQLQRIADAVVLSDKSLDIDKRVLAASNLSFDQFRRVCLLPQGRFDAFLTADGNERSLILERVTGGEIYTRISKSVFEKTKDRRGDVARLRELMQGVPGLNAEERAEIEAALVEQREVANTANAKVATLDQQLAWRTEERNAEIAAAGAEAELNVAQGKLDALAEVRTQLEFLNRIEELRGAYDAWRRAALEAQKAAADWVEAQENEAKLRLGFTGANSEYEVTQAKRKDAEDEVARWAAEWEVAGQLDTQLLELRKSTASLEVDWKQKSGDLEQAQTALASLQREVSGGRGKAKELADWLEARAGWAGVVGDRALLQHRLKEREELNRTWQGLVQPEGSTVSEAEIAPLEGRKSAADGEVGTLRQAVELAPRAAQVGELEQRQHANQQKLEVVKAAQEEAAHASLMAEHAAGKAAAEMRAELSDGEACPVCGSTTHPYREHLDAVGELAAQLKQRKLEREREVAELTKEASSIDKALTVAMDAQKSLSGLPGITTHAERELRDALEAKLLEAAELSRVIVNSRLQVEVTRVSTLLAENRKHLDPMLEALGLKNEAGALDLVDEYARRETAHKSVVDDLQKAEVAHAARAATAGASQAAEVEAKERLRKAEEEEAAVGAKRAQLLGGELLEPHRKQRIDAQGTAVKHAEVAGKALASAQGALEQAEKSVKAYELQNATKQTAVAAAREQFDTRCSGMQLEAERVEAGLGVATAVRQQMLTDLNDAQLRLAEASGKKTNAQEQLSKARERCEGLALSEELSGAKVSAQQLMTEANQRIGDLNRRLAEDAQNQQRRAELEKQVGGAQAELDVWEEVNEAVGSAEGTKFRKFVQGLTLDHLVHLANYHLGTFASRYQLQRSKVGDLGLEVVDREMTGAARPTSTLSGGERFQASLGLALGLSSLEGKDSYVDSLFIDEGFGALDPESLELVMSALESLPSSGRRVGVITHVAGMMDRIAVQVKVTKRGEGRSSVKLVDGRVETYVENGR